MLTDKQIKNAKLKNKPYKLPDSEGLYIRINPKGKKVFFFRFEWHGKDATAPIGEYGDNEPKYSLVKAREKRDYYLNKLANGFDPRQEVDKNSTFSQIADDWFNAMNSTDKDKTGVDFWAKKTQTNYKTRLNYAKQGFGHKPISEVTSEDVLKVCRKIELRGKRSASKRTLRLISNVFDYAFVYDVTKPVSRALLPHTPKNYPHVEGEDNIRKLRDDINNYGGEIETKLALKFVFYNFPRQKMWRLAEWNEIKDDMWHVPKERMKNRKPFVVPLAKQSIEILNTMRELTGDSKYIFSYGYKLNKPFSDSTLGRVLERIGYKDKQCPHGLRHVASTTLNRLKYDKDAIELQLAHVIGSTRGVYNKYDAMDLRTPMMQGYADWLDDL